VAGDGRREAAADEQLRRQGHDAPLRAAPEQRIAVVRHVTGRRGDRPADGLPLPLPGLLPVPPADAGEAVSHGEGAEAPDVRLARVEVDLAEGRDRAVVGPVPDPGVDVALVDRGADRLPIELWDVVMGPTRPEEDGGG